MTCAECLATAESSAAGESSVGTHEEMLAHLEGCPACRAELDARAVVRQTLRRAFEQSAELAPDARFATRLRARLMEAERPPRRRVGGSAPWLALAAGLVLAAVVGWQFWPAPAGGHALAALAGHAAGDHRYCALEHALEQAPITLEEAARQYGPMYGSLREVVADSLPARAGEVEILGAHWCVFEGRRFAHVVVRRSGHVASILLTPVGETAIDPSVNACPPAGGFHVACFGTRGHAGFVVSDLSDAENLTLARAVAPALQAHLARG